MSEIWKPCVGFPHYEVSSLGRVRSPNKILSANRGDYGYPIVALGQGNVRYVHALVLETFVGPRPKGMEACHGDGNRMNARLDNLRWDLPGANGKDKIRHGTAKIGAQKAATTRERMIKMSGYHSPNEMLIAGCTTLRGLRYWESEGLLGEVARTAGDTRQYTDDQLDRARIIAAAQFGGWSLDDIRQMLDEFHADMTVYDAITMRLSDQIRAAARLGEALPKPLAVRSAKQEYDL